MSAARAGMADAVTWRARQVADGVGRGPVTGTDAAPHQIVVKVIGAAKSRNGVRNLVQYIGRMRKQDRAAGLFGGVQVFDEMGAPVSAEEVSATLDEWSLLPDAENVSPWANGLLRRGEVSSLAEIPESDRLYRRQALHVTWSIKGDGEHVPARVVRAMEMATGAVMEEMVLSRDFQALWGLHTEHAAPVEGGTADAQRRPAAKRDTHPHVHMVLRSRSTVGKVLVPDTDWIDEMRAAVVRHARAVGLNVTTERREDREPLRTDILRGVEPLRRGWRLGGDRKPAGGIPLYERAPGWYGVHGLEMERRRQAMAQMWSEAREAAPTLGLSPARIVADRLPARARRRLFGRSRTPPEWAPVLNEIQDAFVDPEAALESWAQLASEGLRREADGSVKLPNLALASWWLRHQPLAFGEVTRHAWRLHRNPRLKKALAGLRPWAQLPAARANEAAQAAARRVGETLRVARRWASDRQQMVDSLSHLSSRVADSGLRARVDAIVGDVMDYAPHHLTGLSELPAGLAPDLRPRRVPPRTRDGTDRGR